MRRRQLAALIAVPMFSLLFWMFTPEVFALIGHIRYGNSARLNGYAFPLHWDDVVRDDQTSIAVSHTPGNFRQRFTRERDTSIISYSQLSPREKDFSYSRDRARLDAAFLKMGERFTSKQLKVAGTSYACWEFEPDLNLNMGNKTAWSIDCRPEGDGLRIFFFGDPNLIPSFYDGLSRITRTQG